MEEVCWGAQACVGQKGTQANEGGAAQRVLLRGDGQGTESPFEVARMYGPRVDSMIWGSNRLGVAVEGSALLGGQLAICQGRSLTQWNASRLVFLGILLVAAAVAAGCSSGATPWYDLSTIAKDPSLGSQVDPEYGGTDSPFGMPLADAVDYAWPQVEATGMLEQIDKGLAGFSERILLVSFSDSRSTAGNTDVRPAVVALGIEGMRIRCIGNARPPHYDYPSVVLQDTATFDFNVSLGMTSEDTRREIQGLLQRIRGDGATYTRRSTGARNLICCLRLHAPDRERTFVLEHPDIIHGHYNDSPRDFDSADRRIYALDELVQVLRSLACPGVSLAAGGTAQAAQARRLQEKRESGTFGDEEAADATGPYPIEMADGWGFCDDHGRPLAKPAFDRARHFYEGLAQVRLEGKWGYADPSGHLAIPAQFDSARRFSEGLAAVRSGANWGFIDSSGKPMIGPALSSGAGHAAEGATRFVEVGDFHEGLAPVKTGTGQTWLGGVWGYIDRKGAFAIEPQFADAGAFHEGLAAASRDGLFGFIDPKGRFVIQPLYQWVGDFSEGLAAVYSRDTGYAYIDKTGAVRAGGGHFAFAGAFSEGFAAVWVEGENGHLGSCGFIDASGKMIIEPQFYEMSRGFRNGLAGVYTKDGYGYITRDGGMAVKPCYKEAWSFVGPLARVQEENGWWGYIDRQGAYVWRLSASLGEGKPE
jgi:hypothetical protein